MLKLLISPIVLITLLNVDLRWLTKLVIKWKTVQIISCTVVEWARFLLNLVWLKVLFLTISWACLLRYRLQFIFNWKLPVNKYHEFTVNSDLRSGNSLQSVWRCCSKSLTYFKNNKSLRRNLGAAQHHYKPRTSICHLEQLFPVN